jgi:hypothetical protein
MQPQRCVQSDGLGWFHQMSVSNHLNLEVAVDTILGYERKTCVMAVLVVQ